MAGGAIGAFNYTRSLNNQAPLAGTTSTTTQQNPTINTSQIQSASGSNNYMESLQFPKDLVNGPRTYHLSFYFEEYSKRSISDQANFTRSTTTPTIRLPMPKNIQDVIELSYDKQELGSAIGAGLGAIQSGSIKDISDNSLSQLGSAAGGVIKGVGINASQLLLNKIGSTEFGSGQQISAALQVATGFAINPFQAVMFKQPNFKTHSFEWIFVPENSTESNTLNQIIKSFKYHSLPDYLSGSSSTLYTYPDRVQMFFSPDDSFLYQFKPCFITAVHADYAPGPAPAFFTGTTSPVAVRLRVDFMEAELWVRSQYIANKSLGVT